MTQDYDSYLSHLRYELEERDVDEIIEREQIKADIEGDREIEDDI